MRYPEIIENGTDMWFNFCGINLVFAFSDNFSDTDLFSANNEQSLKLYFST